MLDGFMDDIKNSLTWFKVDCPMSVDDVFAKDIIGKELKTLRAVFKTSLHKMLDPGFCWDCCQFWRKIANTSDKPKNIKKIDFLKKSLR